MPMSDETIVNEKIKRGAPPKTWDMSKLEFFNPHEHTPEINQLCIGLNKEEVLEYYGITYDDLPEYDKWYFDITFTRGRTTAKSNAVGKLFTAMKGRDALPASLSYLTRFGGDWIEKAGESDKMPKSIKIVVEE